MDQTAGNISPCRFLCKNNIWSQNLILSDKYHKKNVLFDFYDSKKEEITTFVASLSRKYNINYILILGFFLRFCYTSRKNN